MKQEKTGFTLAEILITLSIVGVIASLLIPQLVDKTKSQQYSATLAKSVTQIELGCQNLLQHENNEQTDGSIYTDISLINNASNKLMTFIGAEPLDGENKSESNYGLYAYLPENPLMPAAYALTRPSTRPSSGGSSSRPSVGGGSSSIPSLDTGANVNYSGPGNSNSDWANPSAKENQTSIDMTYGQTTGGGSTSSDRYGNSSSSSQPDSWVNTNDTRPTIPENNTPNKIDITGGTSGAATQTPEGDHNDPGTPLEPDPGVPDDEKEDFINPDGEKEVIANPDEEKEEIVDTDSDKKDPADLNYQILFDSSSVEDPAKLPTITNAPVYQIKNSPASIMFAEATDSDKVFLKMLIDVNGIAKPNRYGKDAFEFHLTNSCKMVPYGLHKTDHYKNNCNDTNIKDGKACAARVVADGFKINY